MKKNKKFSVIIPCYNSENFIERAINSILNQTYRNWELIVINDGSTDNSQCIIDNIINKNFDKKILSKIIENSGPSTARNYGISLATGDYVCFLDSDDEYDKNLFEILNDIDDEFDLCFWGWKDIYEDGRVIDRTSEYEFPKNSMSGIEILKKKYFHEVWLCNCSEIYSRKLLVENNIIYPEGVYAGEDACFIYSSLLHAKKVVSISKPLFLCYNRSCSLMHTKLTQKNLTEFTAINTIINNVGDCKNLSIKQKQELTNMFLALYDFVKITLSKRLVVENSNFFKWKKAVKKYLPDTKINISNIKNNMRKKEYIQAVLFKYFKFLFFIACKINNRRKKK